MAVTDVGNIAPVLERSCVIEDFLKRIKSHEWKPYLSLRVSNDSNKTA